MSAVSNRLTPASRQISTSRVASATSLAPHALKNSLPPPKVPVPKLNTGTLRPEPPRIRYSIIATALPKDDFVGLSPAVERRSQHNQRSPEHCPGPRSRCASADV